MRVIKNETIILQQLHKTSIIVIFSLHQTIFYSCTSKGSTYFLYISVILEIYILSFSKY